MALSGVRIRFVAITEPQNKDGRGYDRLYFGAQ
ncbi:MAG: hypothetical protein JWP57_2892 [Spirosoma sp.]|nr:hypothetical protein [Spirosoma sp.]